MEKVSLGLMLLLWLRVMAECEGNNKDTWATKVSKGNQEVTTLQFYFHDKLSGSNPSAIKIVEQPKAGKFVTGFGVVMMADDPLTVGPDPMSKEVGRARGLYGSAGQKDLGLILALSYTFTEGEYNGSSFSVLSINHAMNPVREIAVVGGTGLFRMARGYAMAKTQTFDAATGDAIVAYNVTLITTNN
nr:dirigent protein 23-like [Ipomoea batatas]